MGTFTDTDLLSGAGDNSQAGSRDEISHLLDVTPEIYPLKDARTGITERAKLVLAAVLQKNGVPLEDEPAVVEAAPVAAEEFTAETTVVPTPRMTNEAIVLDEVRRKVAGAYVSETN